MRTFPQSMLKSAILVLASLLIVACAPNEEVWTGENKNPIQVVCGKSCKTILFSPGSAKLMPDQRRKIKHFVYRAHRHRIYVSSCASNTDHPMLIEERLKAVKQQIKNLGYTPIRLKDTLPAKIKVKNCINLVKGDVYLYAQNCPNRTLLPSTNDVGSNFGCTTNYNLAQMIINPWNLLALPGDNGAESDRVAIGVKNYREGKVSKLNMESSSN